MKQLLMAAHTDIHPFLVSIMLPVDGAQCPADILEYLFPQPQTQRTDMQMVRAAIRAFGNGAIFGLTYRQCLACFMLAHSLTPGLTLLFVNTNYYHLVYCYYKRMSNKFLTTMRCPWPGTG